MQALTFIKFGGSIITDKRTQESANLPVIQRLASEIATACAARPDQRILIGHGSGSFGHHYAARYGVHRGLGSSADWIGFALTARAARKLHGIVIDALLAAGIPALSLQPAAALSSAAGHISQWQTDSIAHALAHRLVPVIHGDVSFDSTQGSAIISTEALFTHLALQTEMQPARIILIGETAVYTADPFIDTSAQLIPLITAENIGQVLDYTGQSHGVDVTGGMRSKIELMWHLVDSLPGLEITLAGSAPGLLAHALLGEAADNLTRIRKAE